MDRKLVPPIIWGPRPEGGLSSQPVGRGACQPGRDAHGPSLFIGQNLVMWPC